MEDQRILHYFIGTICDFSAPPQSVSAPPINLSAPVEDPLYEDPNQTNILDQIAEVTEQALKDELIFGVSGVAVSAEGLRNVPIDEVLEKMQESDNQVVQEEVICADDLHQSDEIILEETEAVEDSFVEDDAIEVTEEEVPWVNDEVVHYTDPAGNTFEAPVIPDPEDDAFECKAEEANLDLIMPVEEKKETNNSADFDLDFVSEEPEEDSGNIPDFF
jgi:hypothetical protein